MSIKHSRSPNILLSKIDIFGNNNLREEKIIEKRDTAREGTQEQRCRERQRKEQR